MAPCAAATPSGRLGGDEFVVICEGSSLAAGPELIAERLLEALKPTFTLSESPKRAFSLSASIGIAMGRRSAAEELLRDADVAMNRAKWDGKNRYAVFESAMQDTVQERAVLDMDLRHALERRQFFLVYQPTFSLSDLRPNGVEALLRWRHPERGVVPPDQFIPLAEETGIITEIGRWVLQEACAQGAAWRAAGLSAGHRRQRLGPAARQRSPDRGRRRGSQPQRAGAGRLDARGDRDRVDAQRRVHRRACSWPSSNWACASPSTTSAPDTPPCRICGSSPSTPSRSTARSSRTSGQSREADTFIHTLVELGKALSIETVAEGIEDEEQLAKLRAESCESGQGFLFARPLGLPGIDHFMRKADAQSVAAKSS